MKINYIFKEKIAVILFVLILSFKSYSQQDLTMNLIPVIPQSSYTNPAFKPTPKFYIGFPALSSVYVGLGHTGFAYKDVFHYSPADDSLHFMDDNMISKLAKTNYLTTNINEEILCFGFKARKSYFSFSFTEKANFQFSYPKELIKLLSYGNGQYVGTTADFKGIGVNASLYHELAFGYSRDVKLFNKDFVFGFRYKILRGLANISTEQNNATIGIAQNDFAHTANTNFIINTTLPNFNSSNKSDSSNSNGNGNNGGNDIGQFLKNSNNKGMGLDFGVSCKLNDKWTFGASVLDLGYIKWKTGGIDSVRTYTSNVNNFIFDGIDIVSFFNKNDSNQTKKLTDSLKNIFKIKTTHDNYKAPLGAKFYLTAVYSISKHDKVGMLLHGEILDGTIHPSATVSYNKWFFNMLSASVSYSIENRSYTNVGFGMALNLGAFQIYAVTDNFYCLFDPEDTKTININFGLNFIFGYKEKKPSQSLYQDTP